MGDHVIVCYKFKNILIANFGMIFIYYMPYIIVLVKYRHKNIVIFLPKILLLKGSLLSYQL